MNAFDLTRLIIGIIAIGIIVIFSIVKLFYKNNPINTKFLIRTALFSALSIVLYCVPYLKFPLPVIFPSFLEIHLDEIPAFIAGFAYGPLSAFFVILVKTLVKMPLTTTLTVGEIADFIYSLSFVIPAALIYTKKRTFKGALIGIGISTIIQLVVSSFITSFGMLNFYSNVMQIPQDSILKMCQAVNPNITSLGWPFLLMIALPFNALKDAIVIIVTILLYKRLIFIINKIEHKKN